MYKPGDLVLVAAKIQSRKEDISEGITYTVKALSQSYSSMTVEEGDIKGNFEEKLTEHNKVNE